VTTLASEPPPAPPDFARPADLASLRAEHDRHVQYVGIDYACVFGFRPLRLDLRLPRSASPENPVPVVVYLHGGGFLFGSRSANPVVEPLWHTLIAEGFAVAAVEYRLSLEARFPAAVHDVKAAVRWLRRFGPELGLRPDRIGVWGESAGGHLATFLGCNDTDPVVNGDIGVTGVSADVQAAVPWFAPTDFASMDAQLPPDAPESHDAEGSPEWHFLGGKVQDNLELARFASPISHASAGAAPMLFLHGTGDRLVPPQQSEMMAAALRAAGAEADYVPVEGADHGFLGADLGPIIARTVKFLRTHLA
jgi:acetyl esterase/lipase